MTNDELLKLIILQRQVGFQYKLDTFTDQSLGQIKRGIDKARNQVVDYISDRGEALTSWGGQRSTDILNEIDKLTFGIKGQLVNDISDISSIVGERALEMHSDILSFGGRVAKFNTTLLSAAQLKSIVLNTPVGGHLLKDWVDRTFTTNLQQNIKEDILAGMLRGKGYRDLINGVEEGFNNISRREAITLTRTYVQSANVGAMESVYRDNADIVKKVKWSATLEGGYSKSGRGTCVRCACLDGEEYPIDDHPPCPLHPRCRCSLLPQTVTYRELGLDMDEVRDVYRPYTIRPSESIDVGRRKQILEVGFHDGDYGSFYASRGKKFQSNVVGPVRQQLISDADINFKDLVNRQTGRLLRLDELGFTRSGQILTSKVLRYKPLVGYKHQALVAIEELITAGGKVGIKVADITPEVKEWLAQTVKKQEQKLYRGIGLIEARLTKEQINIINTLKVGDDVPDFLQKQYINIASYTKKKSVAKSYSEGKLELVFEGSVSKTNILVDLENLQDLIRKDKFKSSVFNLDDFKYMKTDREVFVIEPVKLKIISKKGKLSPTHIDVGKRLPKSKEVVKSLISESVIKSKFISESTGWIEAKSLMEAKKQFKEKYKISNFSIQGYPQKQKLAKINEYGRYMAEMIEANPGLKGVIKSGKKVSGCKVYNDLSLGKGSSSGQYVRNQISLAGQAVGDRDITIGAGTSGNTVENTFRHEYGHHVFFNRGMNKIIRREKWEKFFHDKNKGSYWEDKVSWYASTDDSEAFAEAFAAFTSPKYNLKGSLLDRLPKEIEEILMPLKRIK